MKLKDCSRLKLVLAIVLAFVAGFVPAAWAADAFQFRNPTGNASLGEIDTSGNVVFRSSFTASSYFGDGSNLTGVTVSNAATADALSANPTDCGDGFYALGIDADGTAVCSAVNDTDGGVNGSTAAVTANVLFDHEAKASVHHTATVDTGPSPDCSGTTTYQDGEGNCDELNAVYVEVAGDTMTGSLVVSGSSIVVDGGILEWGEEVNRSTLTAAGGINMADNTSVRDITGTPILRFREDNIDGGGGVRGWQLNNMAGTPSNVPYSFLDETDRGMYGPDESNTLGFVTSGIERLRIKANGDLNFGDVIGGSVSTMTQAGALTMLGNIDGSGFTEGGSNTLSNDISGVAATATALAANPNDCSANEFAQSIVANGDLTCAAIADADVPNGITIDLAATATALAANPTDCSAGSAPEGIDADGTAANCTDYIGTGGGESIGGTLSVGSTTLEFKGSAANSAICSDTCSAGAGRCLYVSTTDFDVYTSTATDGWRNGRTGIGPC